MSISAPTYQSQLSQQTHVDNFLAVQSARLTVTNTSNSVTFTDVPGANRVTFKITNTGTASGCYVASGIGSATAVVSSSTPTPTAGVGVVATCDYYGQGTILIQDFVAGTNTIAGICDGSGSTTLEISVGYGQ